jgi:hypothetical protein
MGGRSWPSNIGTTRQALKIARWHFVSRFSDTSFPGVIPAKSGFVLDENVLKLRGA